MNNSYNWGGPINFSYEEQVVGTWIDGKPLYQRTILYTNPVLDWSEQPIGIPNLDWIQAVGKAYLHYTGGGEDWWATEFYYNATNYFFFNVAKGNGNFRSIFMPANTRPYFKQMVITLQYTKTTD